MRTLIIYSIAIFLPFVSIAQSLDEYSFNESNRTSIDNLVKGVNEKDSSVLKKILDPSVLTDNPEILEYLFDPNLSLTKAISFEVITKEFPCDNGRVMKARFINDFNPKAWKLDKIWTANANGEEKPTFKYLDYIDNFHSVASNSSLLNENDDWETSPCVANDQLTKKAVFASNYLIAKHMAGVDTLTITTEYILCNEDRLTCGWKVTDLRLAGTPKINPGSSDLNAALIAQNKDLHRSLANRDQELEIAQSALADLQALQSPDQNRQAIFMSQLKVNEKLKAKNRELESSFGERIDYLESELSIEISNKRAFSDSIAGLNNTIRQQAQSLKDYKAVEVEKFWGESLVNTINSRPIKKEKVGVLKVVLNTENIMEKMSGEASIKLVSHNKFENINTTVYDQLTVVATRPNELAFTIKNSAQFLTKKHFRDGPLSVYLVVDGAEKVKLGRLAWVKRHIVVYN